MHSTYENMQEVDTYMAMLRLKNGSLNEKADIKTGFTNYKTRINL